MLHWSGVTQGLAALLLDAGAAHPGRDDLQVADLDCRNQRGRARDAVAVRFEPRQHHVAGVHAGDALSNSLSP